MSPPKHGLPDWGVTAGAETIYQMNDLGEAVARLGSPVTFDRRGDILSIESFADGLGRWVISTAGARARVNLSRRTSRTGAYSALLYPGWDAPYTALIYRFLPFPILSILGLEASFTSWRLSEPIEIRLDIYDGATLMQFYARYRYNQQDLQIYDNVAGYVTVASGIQVVTSTQMFNTMKLVGNPINQTYSRLLFNNHSLSLTDYTPRIRSVPADPRLTAVITAYGDGVSETRCYVDDVILTQNEPAQP